MNDSKGRSSLHFSAESGSYELVKFVMYCSASIYLRTKNGMNCLHTAALNGNLNLCKTLVNKHNFDVHMTDNNGFTSLHLSAQNGRYELIKFFIGKGTDIYLKTKTGLNCLHIAAGSGHFKLASYLLMNITLMFI